MTERQRHRINDPEPADTSERLSQTNDSLSQATNGSGGEVVTAESPLPDKLAELERRISAALTEPRTASDLSDLIEQTDLAVVAATEHAKLESDKALDPLASPDPHAARQQAKDAAFMANRLRTLRPRLLARLHQVTQQEEVQSYRAKQSELAPERDALQRELRETYEDATAKLVDLFSRVRAYQQRAQQQLGDPPPGVSVLSALDARVLDKCVLPEFAQPDRNVWPPPSSFASDFSTSMPFDSHHPGQAWSSAEYQQRRHADLLIEQQRNAEYHEQAAREQEARQNREQREQFLAQQRQ